MRGAGLQTDRTLEGFKSDARYFRIFLMFFTPHSALSVAKLLIASLKVIQQTLFREEINPNLTPLL
jgi:hypothetical protein